MNMPVPTQGFRAHPTATAPQGFVPMTALGVAARDFARQRPQDMVRSMPVPVAQLAVDEPPAPALAPVTEPATEVDHAPAPVSALPPGPVPSSDEVRRAALAEGVARGRAEAEAEFATARAALDAAAATLCALVDGITHASESETEALAHTLGHVVRTLASERAGVQIDQDPAGFGARIAALADRIVDGHGALAVMLNTQDLAALVAARSPEAPQLERLLQADLRADAALSRGDVRLRARGLSLDDLIRCGTLP